MKRTSFFLMLLILLGSYINPIWSRSLNNRPGYMDLSRINISGNNVVPLDQKWLYQEGVLSCENNVINSNQMSVSLTNITDSMNRQFPFILPERLVGQIRMTVKLPASVGDYNILIPPVHSPGMVCIFSESQKSYISALENDPANNNSYKYVSIHAGSALDTVTIYISFSGNYNWQNGPTGVPLLGLKNVIEQKLRQKKKISLWFLGAGFALAIYHFFLFSLERKRKSSLYFGIIATITTWHTCVESSLLELFFSSHNNYLLLLKIQTAGNILGPGALILFLKETFHLNFNQYFIRFIYITTFTYFVFSLFYSISFSSSFVGAFILLMAYPVAYTGISIIRKDRFHNIPRVVLVTLALVFFAVHGAHQLILQFPLFSGGGPEGFLMIFATFLLSFVILYEVNTDWNRERNLSVSFALETNRKSGELHRNIKELRNRSLEQSRDLSIASRIQRNLLPVTPLQKGHYTFDAFNQTRDGIGSDSYDIFSIDESCHGVLMINAHGSGVPAALVSAMARIIFAEAVQVKKTSSAILNHVSQVMQSSLKTGESFTACLLLLSENGTIQYSNASHKAPILIKRDKSNESLKVLKGKAFGQVNNTDDSMTTYETSHYTMESGDRIIIYSDGFISQPVEGGTAYGRQSLIKVATENINMPVHDIRQLIIGDWISQRGSKTIKNDSTFLIIGYDPPVNPV